MSRPPATLRKVGRVLVLLALFLACQRAAQTARALLGAGAVQFPRSVPPGIWARNLLVARRAEADGTLDGGEAEDEEDDKGPREDDNENKDEQLQENKEAPAKESELTFKNYDEQMVRELRELCRARGLPSNGTKAELKAALAKDDEERRPVEAKAASVKDAEPEAAVQAGVPVRQRRVWLQVDVEGNPYDVFLGADAIGADLRHLATPDVSDRQRANVKLFKSDGTELDLDGKVPLDAGSSSKSPVRIEGAPSSEFQASKTVSGKDLQDLKNISGPNVTIEDWMVGLGMCGNECLEDIQTFAPKSDSDVDRVPPLMLSRCMRGGKTTFLAYLFELVKAEPGYLPIFISFNGFSGIQRKDGESRLQTMLRAIAVTLLPATPTDTQSVSCDEDTLCDHLERQNGTIVLMIDELNLLVPKGTTDNEVASFLRGVFLSPENRYLVFTTHEPFDGSQIAEYTGGKSWAYSPRGVIARDLPRSVNVTEQRGIPQCRALSAGNVLFFSGIPSLLRSWKQQYSFQARFEQLTKPKKTPGLLESFVREFLDGRRQSGDAIRAFDCLTATSDQGDAKWILCYAAQMCSYLNQRQLADWINRLQMDASDPLSGKGWEVLVVLAAAFRCLEAMAGGDAGHGLLGLPPNPNIKTCYFWDVPSEVSTLDEALQWWARQDIPPTFPFVAVLNPLCSTFEIFDCILLYQRSKLRVLQVRGFQQKAGRTYPDKNARHDVDSVWMQGKAAENRRSEQAKGWTLLSAREIRAFLGASLRDLFPKELDT